MNVFPSMMVAMAMIITQVQILLKEQEEPKFGQLAFVFTGLKK